MRPVSFFLKNMSPLLLAREAAWRTSRKWRRVRLASELKQPCPVRFRPAGYYSPALEDYSKKAQETWITHADHVCSGIFSILGYPPAQLGFPPLWDCDFISGMSWPHGPSRNISVVRHDGSDVKVPWELSRLQFLPVLGKSWKLTKDKRYRNAAQNVLADWISKQPFGVGMNWTVPMEAALRAISICLSLELFWPFDECEEAWLSEVTQSLWHHFRFIESQIEFSYLARGNHYLSNLLGLFCLSVFLKGGGIEDRREEFASLFATEALLQCYSDGGNYEASTGYLVFVGQMLFFSMRLMKVAGIPISARFVTRLRDVHRLMADLADARGRLPQVGDCDDGRVELHLDDLDRLSMEAGRNSLAIPSMLEFAAALLEQPFTWERGDLAWFGVSSRTPPERRAGRFSEKKLRLFPESGIGIIRQQRCQVVLFAMPNGIRGLGSHTHNDKLSIVVRLCEEELLSDSGTCTYTRDAGIRNHFRSTKAHNTVVVDGQEQNRMDTRPIALFCLGDDAHVNRIEGREQDGAVVLTASHTGYCRLGVTHKRSVEIGPTEDIQIEDSFTGAGGHTFEAYFHVGIAWRVLSTESIGTNVIVFRLEGPQSVEIRLTAAVSLRGWTERGVISKAYGAEVAADVIKIAAETELPFTMRTYIKWEN